MYKNYELDQSFINKCFIVILFLGMILVAPPFIYSLYEWLTYDKDKVSYDDRSGLIYANIEWADKHFLEFDSLLQHIMIIFLGVVISGKQ